MTGISFRAWAGALTLMLLTGLALASDGNSANNGNTGANGAAATAPAPPAATTATTTSVAMPVDPLLRLMVIQGLVTKEEVGKLAGMPSSELRDRLLLLLLMKNKNALTAEDLNALNPSTTSAVNATQPVVSTETVSISTPTSAPQPPQAAPGGGVIPAVAPIRVLPIGAPKREGVLPVISIGKDVHIAPYGFLKASAIYDTSSPYGNDFPLPGFIGDINGPDAFPEFRVKARFARFGSSFEWLENPNVVVTGKVEADFEGNFSRANNRNISSIRSNMLSLRLAYGRIDWKASDTTSLFFLGGQDWTPFASSTLPPLFETTGLGVGYGSLYERDPQFRVGLTHKLSNDFSITPEFAIVLPSFGNLPSNVADQLGFAERQGVDSGKPEVQARLVTQFQLDHAPGVAPAQIIVSGVHGSRTATVLASAVPAAFKAAFPSGTQVSSNRNAWTGEVQLPTRYLTLIAKYYNGTDLRFYFGNQLYSEFNDTTGLTATATAPSVDGSSTLVFGNLNGVPVVAPQLPVRGQGGFVNLGLPLSRWAHADPTGRNSGWVMYLHYGFDEALARDVRRVGGGRQKSDLAAGTLTYKLNKFVTFNLEESYYRTRAIPLTSTGQFPLFEGRPTRVWKDFRSEFGPLFTF